MSTFPSIRQNLRLIEGGLWHTPAYSRATVVQSDQKCNDDGLFEARNTLSDGCLKLFSGRNSGRRRRRRSMARTYVILAFGLSLAGCNTPQPKAVAGQVCSPQDVAWVECMKVRKPGRHPPAELLFTDWRT